jgi:hypothetical protein
VAHSFPPNPNQARSPLTTAATPCGCLPTPPPPQAYTHTTSRLPRSGSPPYACVCTTSCLHRPGPCLNPTPARTANSPLTGTMLQPCDHVNHRHLPRPGSQFNYAGASQGVDARVSQDTAAGGAGRRWPPTTIYWIRRGCAAWAMNPWPRPWCALCRHAPMVAPPSPAHLLLNVSEKLASIPPQPFLSSSFVWLVIPHVIEY